MCTPINKNNNEIYVIDRFEGNQAVLEAVHSLEVSAYKREQLPLDIKPGDVLRLQDGIFYIDREETERRRARIKARFNRMKKKRLC